jgi:1-acyl-sn-glycerol-3-phosphate acyltransferase
VYFWEVKHLRLVRRLLIFVGYTAWVVWRMAILNKLFGYDYKRCLAIRKQWANRLLDSTGVEVTVSGNPPTETCLFMGNHRSYLDPILVLRDLPVWPVAKAEIAHWPFIGKGAAMAGILYVRRDDSNNRAKVLHQMGNLLSEGKSVLLFPEGNTCPDPCGTLSFHTGGFRLAARDGYAVAPISFHFHDPRDFWIGAESFLSHGIRTFKRKKIGISVEYGPVFRSADPVWLRESCQSWIIASLKRQVSNKTGL